MAPKKIVEGIRAYLDGLGVSDKPVVDREAVKQLRAQARAETDPINKLKLLTQLEEEQQGKLPDRSGDEAVFVAEAQAWAEGEGISVTALRAFGVPDDVLKRAGFALPTGTSGSRGADRGTATGTRAPRLSIDDVEAAAKSLGSGWKLSDLAEKIDRDPATARNYLKKLLDGGSVTEVGDDPDHGGRGRAPKIYAAA